MLTTLSNLPKWLLALVALCVFAGYADQIKCKTAGCKPVVASVETDAAGSSLAPGSAHDGEQDCQCQCHFTTLSFDEAPAACVRFVRAVAALPPVWVDNTPEAPCADIEHPPQLA